MPEEGGVYYYHHKAESNLLPVVIVLHGLGSDHLSWPVEIRRLPGFRVFTPDLPGHGNSLGPGYQSVTGYANRMVDFMDSIAVWQAVFVGHSMGGAIALEIASRHPQRVSGLALISCGARLPVPRQVMENAANPATFPTAVRTLLSLMSGPGTNPRLAEQNQKKIPGTPPFFGFG